MVVPTKEEKLVWFGWEQLLRSVVCSSEASAVSATIDGKESIFSALNSAPFSDQRDRAFVDYLLANMLQYNKPDEVRGFVLFCSICF